MIPHTQNQPTAASEKAIEARLDAAIADARDSRPAPIFDQLVRDMAILTTADDAHDDLDITIPADDTTAAKRIFAAVILSVMASIALVAIIYRVAIA